jgi:hypothetical protein
MIEIHVRMEAETNSNGARHGTLACPICADDEIEIRAGMKGYFVVGEEVLARDSDDRTGHEAVFSMLSSCSSLATNRHVPIRVPNKLSLHLFHAWTIIHDFVRRIGPVVRFVASRRSSLLAAAGASLLDFFLDFFLFFRIDHCCSRHSASASRKDAT